MKNVCEQAALYFYGELSEPQASAFKAHLEGCSACQKELAFLEQTQAALVPPAAPQDLVEKVLQKSNKIPFWQRVYKPVLAGLLVVSFIVCGFIGRASFQNTEEVDNGWLAYVSDELDDEYNNFVLDFESFENEF